jgi:hypothetical protein
VNFSRRAGRDSRSDVFLSDLSYLQAVLILSPRVAVGRMSLWWPEHQCIANTSFCENLVPRLCMKFTGSKHIANCIGLPAMAN